MKDSNKKTAISCLPKKQQLIRSLPVEFVFLTLPYKEIEGTVYQKESDKATLSITSGYDTEKREYYGIPYGIYPRMILYFICSEVRRTKNKEVILGKNIQDVLEKMALTEKGIRNNGVVLKSFKEQLLRLTTSVITVTSREEKKENQDTRFIKESVKIVRKIEFWKKSDKVDYKLTLTDDFFNYLVNSSVTVFDTKILHSIKSSPVSLDLYVLLNYKSFIANKFNNDLFVSFKELHEYFGTKDTFRSFKQNIKSKVLDLLKVYTELSISIQDNKKQSGIVVTKDSMSSVQPDMFSSNYL